MNTKDLIAIDVHIHAEEGGIKGFKFHPTLQGFFPNDRMTYGLYEVIAEHNLTALFHSGRSGIGTGMPGGDGLRLKYSNPLHVDDVAVDFPTMKTVIAHPSWPWTDEALSVCLHCLYRLVGLVAQVFPAATGAVCEYSAQEKNAVRFGFSVDRSRPMDQGLQGSGLQAGSP